MLSLRVFGLALAILLPTGAVAQTGLLDPDFEAAGSGWSTWGGGVIWMLGGDGCAHGQQCATLRRTAPAGDTGFGIFAQTTSAVPYRGRRLRFRTAVRVEGSGAYVVLWMRFDAGNTMLLNLNSVSIRRNQWQYYDIEGDVGSTATVVNAGYLVFGSGSVVVDDAQLTLLRVDAPEAARPLSETGLANLTAFAHLFGYVRHFHPSDQALFVNWHEFAVRGVRAVEDAGTPEELAARLWALFEPVAPAVRVFPTGQRPTMPEELLAATPQIARWNHYGVAVEGDSYYRSYRVIEDAGVTDPTQPYEAEIGRGLSAMVPLSLYVEGGETLPARAQPAQASFQMTQEDRGTRLAGVIEAWNVAQHFYPYFDVVETDWPAALDAGLRSAAEESDEVATLSRMWAKLKDGHGRVNGPTTAKTVPLVWDWVEDQLVVTRVKDAQGQAIARGDRVLTIDGKPVEEVMAETAETVSGATPQWLLLRTLGTMLSCNASNRMQLEIEPYGRPGQRQAMQFACAADYDLSEEKGAIIRELEPGIWYVDVDRATQEEFALALPYLERADGIVFDERGYLKTFVYLAVLSHTAMSSAQWHIPVPALPDRTDLKFAESSWMADVTDPYLTAKRVFLIDGHAISAAETFTGIVENYRLAEFVGSATAGTNGNINYVRLPGGITLIFTGMKVLKHDGTQHHGVGIRPNITAGRTRKGIAEGRDEVLARGVEVLKGPKDGPAPEIRAVVNAAGIGEGPLAPGEMVTIFGTGLGPPELVQGTYDGSGMLATYTAETRVFFDDEQAPFMHVTATQVTAVAPLGISGSTKVRVEYQLRRSDPVTVAVADAAPAIFGGVWNQDGTVNAADHPASRGSVVSLYCTGVGKLKGSPVYGKLPMAGKWPAPEAALTVSFGDVEGEVQFAGQIAPGVVQLNVKVPASAPEGEAVPLVLKAGGTAARVVGVALR